MATTAGPVTSSTTAAGGIPSQPAAAAAGTPGARAADEPRYTVSVSCRVDGEAAQVSFTTFRRTLIQQIMDSSLAFFKISPSQSQTAQLVLGGKQVISFSAQSTVEDLKLTTPDRQSLELVLLDEEPEVTFPVRDQYGNEDLLRARLYHPFVDAVRRLLDPDSPALQAPIPPPPPAATNTSTGGNNSQNNQQQAHGLDVDLYRSSDVSLISLQNSPAACGLQGGEPLLLYRYGRCSREYWHGLGQPDRGLKPTFAGLYISDYKNQFQGRAVFRHDLAMPLEYLLATYCKWRGIDKDKASFLWLQFYMRLSLKDTGLGRGMDDGDTIYIFDKQDPQGKLWDGVLDGNVEAVKGALDEGASLEGPDGSFEAITSRWPLHAAAANNHLAVAEVLVERGADVDKLDAVSEPALWHAVEQGHGEMVALLLKLGATASDLPCPAGKTKADYAALCHAAEKGSLSMVQLLLDKGANPYTYDDTGYCAYDYLVDQAKPLELLRALLNADGAFSATQKSYQQAYQRLCAAVKRAQRYPALGCNCRTCNSVVEVRAAEAEATQTLKAQIGCVALVRAVQAGGPHCLEAMQLLHVHGALLDGQDQDGRTALHQAIRYNRLAEAKWLVSAGAHLDVADFEGLLPLHQAACTGNVEFARLLVEAGAPINLHTVKYITQESLEAQTKKQEAGSGGRKAAKKRNALDVTGLTTIGGNSALALAVRHGHAAVVEYLLSQQASFDLKNPADSSAFHAALDRGAASVASKLLQHLNKPKPGKAGAGVASGALMAPQAVSKIKAKDTTASKDKTSRKASVQVPDAHCKSSSGGAAVSAAAAVAGQSTSDSEGGGTDKGVGGDISSPEPALAVDAGAGLREIVQAERERLRQEKGLGRTAAAEVAAAGAGPGASALKAAPSLMQQLEALKAAEKAAAAKAAAEQAAAAAKARAEAEQQAAERAKQEEEARKRAEEATKAKVEEEKRRKQEEEERKREEGRQREEEQKHREEEKRREEERRKEEEAAAAKKRTDEAAAAAAAAARTKAESDAAAKVGRCKAAGSLPNCAVVATADLVADTSDADAADSIPAATAKPGVQILFRSTSTIAPPMSTKQQASVSAPAGPQTPTTTSSAQKALRAGSLPMNTSSTAAAEKALLATASSVTHPSAKKGKGRAGKANAIAPDAEHAFPSPSSVPNTPSKHLSSDHGHGKQSAAPAASGKRGANAKSAAATPTAAALAASAALAHSTASTRSVGSTGSGSHPHSNGPSHQLQGFDTGYGGGYSDDHVQHHGGHSHNATPGLSPRHGTVHMVNSAASTPVRSSKPSSRRNSFSSGSLNTLTQHPWPGQQQQGQQQQSQSQLTLNQPTPLTPQQQVSQPLSQDPAAALFSATSHPATPGAVSLRMPPGIMVSGQSGMQGGAGGVQNLGELGGPGLHMAPHHHLSPLRHSPPGPRVPASGTPTGMQDDPGLWDDAGHLESFVMSVVTDDGSGTPNGRQQQHIGRRGNIGHVQHTVKASSKGDGTGGDTRLPPSGHSPFKLGMQQASGWGDMAAAAPAGAASGSTNGTPRAPPPGVPAPQRAATAPGLDRVASADMLAALAAHQHLPTDTGGNSTRPAGSSGQRLDEQFAGWMQGNTPGGMLQQASAAAAASGMDSSTWTQQQGNSQQGGTGGTPSWGSWMQSGTATDLLGSSSQKAATGSGDSAQQFLSGGTGGGGGSSMGTGSASTLLVGAAPFVPGEQSHWQSRGGAAESGASSGARELDPLPHLPASLFEDDADLPPAQVEPQQQQPPPLQQQTSQKSNNGRLQPGSASSSSGQQGVGGPQLAGQQGTGNGQQPGGGGRTTPGVGGGMAGGGGRPSSRGRPSSGMHNRTASAGNSQDGSVAAAGRYPATGAGVRMPLNAYGGPASGGPQPSLPGLYNNPKQADAWYASQQGGGWQQPGHAGSGYPPGIAGVQSSSQHGLPVQAAHAANPHAHSAAMYQVLTSMNMGGAASGLGAAGSWGDAAAAAAAAAAAGPQVNGYWPAMGRAPQGINDLMGGPRGRPLAPSQGQPPRYRQH